MEALIPNATGAPALSRADARAFLDGLVLTLTEVMRSQPFHLSRARRVGRLLAGRFTSSEAIGATMGVLFQHLGRLPGAPGSRVGAVMDQVAAGYTEARLEAQYAEQELLRRLWTEPGPAQSASARSAQAEREQQEQAAFRAAFEVTPVGQCLTGADRRAVQVNPAFAALIDAGAEECAGVSLDGLVDARDAAAVVAAHRGVVRGETPTARLQVRCHHRDGHQVRLSLEMRPLSTGGSAGPRVLVTATDATLRGDLAVLAAAALHTDPLTYLANRETFQDALAAACAEQHRVHVVYLHLDNLRTVNTVHGDREGDRALREAAERFARAVAHRGMVARISGSTFGVLLDPEADGRDACRAAADLQATLTDPVRLSGAAVRLTATTATLSVPAAATTPQRLMTAAHTLVRRPGLS